MHELSINDLIDRKNRIIEDIKYIEENYEGINNPLNSEKIKKLNSEKATLMQEKKIILDKLSDIDSKLRRINVNIRNLSGEGIDIILDAISKQRWFFFKNKPKVLMDRYTGILWANLDYFEFYNVNSENHTFTYKQATQIVDNLELDGYKNWTIPTSIQLVTMIDDKTFPFQEGNCHRIKNLDYWFAIDGDNYCIDLDNYNMGQASVYLLPCNTSLTSEEYEINVLSDSRIYTNKEKMQFALDIFINNELEPIFNDEKVNQLYEKIYIEKPILKKELEEIKTKIGTIQDNIMLSTAFDFSALIQDYDLNLINNSIIKYYKAVQNWIDTLIDMLEFFETEKISIIKSYDDLNDKMLKKYEYELEMTEDENSLFEKRREYFKKCLALNMTDTKSKLLSIRKKADDIEIELDKINSGDNVIEDLARLENKDRASFELIAENTIEIIQAMLKKAEYFEKNKRILSSLINIDHSWENDYKMLKIKFKSKYKNICEREGIGSYIWNTWYREWCSKRFAIEQLFLSLAQREITSSIKESNGNDEIVSVVEKLLNALQLYKDNIDDFYTNQRKDIYIKYANLVNGELQENLEVSKELDKLNSYLKGNMENIVANVKKLDDKLFLQKWIKPLVNINL